MGLAVTIPSGLITPVDLQTALTQFSTILPVSYIVKEGRIECSFLVSNKGVVLPLTTGGNNLKVTIYKLGVSIFSNPAITSIVQSHHINCAIVVHTIMSCWENRWVSADPVATSNLGDLEVPEEYTTFASVSGGSSLTVKEFMPSMIQQIAGLTVPESKTKVSLVNAVRHADLEEYPLVAAYLQDNSGRLTYGYVLPVYILPFNSAKDGTTANVPVDFHRFGVRFIPVTKLYAIQEPKV